LKALKVRPASLSDAEALASLVTQLGYPSTGPEMSERLASLLSDPCYAAFVAHDRSTVLGLGGGNLARYFERNGAYARLVILVVAEGARERGVGAALVEAVERWALARGARELVVNSGSHRREAHRFYERAGFRITGIRLVKDLPA
jgi:GNAT superfamily N-acetyltransferase